MMRTSVRGFRRFEKPCKNAQVLFDKIVINAFYMYMFLILPFHVSHRIHSHFCLSLVEPAIHKKSEQLKEKMRKIETQTTKLIADDANLRQRERIQKIQEAMKSGGI